MQGNLNEIDIRTILQLVELGQRTGELLVEAYSNPASNIASSAGSQGFVRHNFQSPKEKSWFIFFLNGQIIYVTNSDSSLSRLRDYLCRYRLETSLDRIATSSLATNHAPEYTYLWALLEQGILTPAQARSIIQSIVRETLFDLLGLHQGFFIFEDGPALAPQLTALKIGSLVATTMQQVQEWKQLNPHIQSPDQYLAIADFTKLRQLLPAATVDLLQRWAEGKTSLRQLARYLNQDISTVGRTIYPFVKHGWIQLIYPLLTASSIINKDLQLFSEKIPRIVCIDDSIAVCKLVESTLQLEGYEATSCSNPLEFLSLVFQIEPDLILCDIAMPELNGYELCAMLRCSNMFRQTPIVMLTGKDWFIDRVRARMVGATDYLTKPFTERELLMIVEKHLQLHRIHSTQQQTVANA